MVLLLRKLYLYFTKDPEGVQYFSFRKDKISLQNSPGGAITFSAISLKVAR